MRPIAVGETIRRLTSSMVLQRERERICELLKPLQQEVATPGGLEAIVHAARQLTWQHDNDNDLGILQIHLE